MWRSPSASERMWMPAMSETMEETMKREQEELLATLMRANSALSQLFGFEEDENE
jgi:hypothetical protein